MIKRSVASVLLCCIIVCAGAQSTTVFSINKKPVTTEEFIYLYKKNNQGRSGEFTEAKIDEYLGLFINFKLKVEEARHRGLDTTASFRKEYNTYREELRKPYLPDGHLVDSLVELTYNRMKEEVRASHILIAVKPDATPEDTAAAYQKIMDIRTRALAGENFETLASTYSDDPSAKTNRGNLGYFTALQMVFPFEQAAYNTKVGETSLPVRTQFGYHLVHVTDRKPARGEVEVSHIMIRTGEGYDDAKAKNTIFDVYDQLQKGVKWEDLCREYSQDISSKDNGGKLRAFGVGAMSGIPEFEQVAFSLKNPGDFSDPFKTQFGWHILRLESKIPLPSFQELSASLKNRVSRDDRVQVSRQAVQNKMKREFGFNEDKGILLKVFSLADTSLTQASWKNKADEALMNAVLFTAKGVSYPASDFLRFAEHHQKPSALPPSRQMEQLYSQHTEGILGQLLEEKIKQQNPDYGWLLKEYYEGILLFEIMEKEVWNKASEDSVGQRKYYEEHRADYQAKERVKGKIFSSSSKELIEKLRELVQQGDSAKVQEFVSAQRIRQETGAFEKTERPVLARIEWKPGIAVSENNNTHYLVWVKSVLPPGSKSFGEARPSVISDYQNFLEKRWLEQLRKKYPVKVNKKGKKEMMQQLVADVSTQK